MTKEISPSDLDFFRDLPPLNSGRLESLGEQVRFDRDQLIFREGEPSVNLYVILRGSVSLEVTAPGKTLRMLTIHQGEEFGWSSVLPKHRKHFQARALTQVDVLAFDGRKLLAACDAEPAFGYALMKHLLAGVADRLDAIRVQLLDVYSVGDQ